MKSIFQAVDYIQTKGIVHRDLKPGKLFLSYELDNILIGDPSDLSSIKLADFGLSAKHSYSTFQTLDQHCGTLVFMAPEVVFNKDYTKVRFSF